jgi:hypothetical protein
MSHMSKKSSSYPYLSDQISDGYRVSIPKLSFLGEIARAYDRLDAAVREPLQVHTQRRCYADVSQIGKCKNQLVW